VKDHGRQTIKTPESFVWQLIYHSLSEAQVLSFQLTYNPIPMRRMKKRSASPDLLKSERIFIFKTYSVGNGLSSIR
jgi:hypothetical protein